MTQLFSHNIPESHFNSDLGILAVRSSDRWKKTATERPHDAWITKSCYIKSKRLPYFDFYAMRIPGLYSNYDDFVLFI